MNPIDATLALLKERDKLLPHCEAETQDNRPFEHWKTHCVNCGAHMTRKHVRDDCPPQGYEQLGELDG